MFRFRVAKIKWRFSVLPCKLWRLLHIQKWLFMKTTCEVEDEDEGGILWKAKAQHGPMVHELSSINLKVLFNPAARQMFIIFRLPKATK